MVPAFVAYIANELFVSREEKKLKFVEIMRPKNEYIYSEVAEC